MRRQLTRIAALATIIAVWWATGLPQPSSAGLSAVAADLSFQRSELQPVRIDRWQHERTVAPRAEKLQAWISGVGASVALTDLRGRGLSGDICHVDPRTDSVTISAAPNTGPGYTPFALEMGSLPVDRDTSAPTGCLPGDFNEDGHADLLVYFWGRTPVVLTRNPDAALSPSAFRPSELVANVGDRPDEWYTDSVAAADIDSDGHVDLVLGNYFQDGSRLLDANADDDRKFAMNDSMNHALNGGSNHIFLSKGSARDGTPQFEDVKNAFTRDESHAWTLAIGAQDLNDDGRPELYFANDFGPDRLFVNRSTPGTVRLDQVSGAGGFAIPKSKVLGRDSFKGMGIDFGDLNSDGHTDMFVSNISAERGLMETNYAWINTGNEVASGKPAPFTEESETLGVARTGWGWDAKIADFDNDASPEIVQSLGFASGKRDAWPQVAELAMSNDGVVRDPMAWMQLTEGWGLSSEDHPAFFKRSGDVYVDISEQLGFDEQGVTRAVATGDVDGDGRLDVAIAGQFTDSYIYRNTTKTTDPYLALRVLRSPDGDATTTYRSGKAGNVMTGTPAIGATVTVTLPNGRTLTQQVDGGNGHASVRSPDLHFGLGDIEPEATLTVDVSWVSTDRREAKTLSLTPGRWSVSVGR